MGIELKRGGLQRVTAALGAVLVAAILTGRSKKDEALQAVAVSASGHLVERTLTGTT